MSQNQTPTIWSHEETLRVIKSYEEICKTLNINHLTSIHWQHISQTLPTLSKTPTQCRHKLDTLRKRYRSELSKLPQPSSWVYFPLMHHLQQFNNNIITTVNDDSPSLDHSQPQQINNNNNNKRRRKGGDVAGEMRDFVDMFVKVEKMKMEVIRENERFKIEMENKRLQMILVSHQKTVDFISNTFGLKND